MRLRQKQKILSQFKSKGSVLISMYVVAYTVHTDVFLVTTEQVLPRRFLITVAALSSDALNVVKIQN